MVCLTLALSMMIGGLTACGSADSGTTGASAAPASSTVSAAKEADSQDIAWPEGPVQIIVGANAGGGIDTAARLIGKYMEKYMGQSFVCLLYTSTVYRQARCASFRSARPTRRGRR